MRVPYAPDRVARIKTIVGRRWHQGERCWTIPHTDGTLRQILAHFADEPVEVDDSLRSDTGLSALVPPGEPPLAESPSSTKKKI